MNKYQAKNLLPIIEAFANGKQIQTIAQVTSDGRRMWVDTNEPRFETASDFRIKPERVYRPFKKCRRVLAGNAETSTVWLVKGQGRWSLCNGYESI